MMIVYHMYVLVYFVHKNHQSFVAVIENEAVGNTCAQNVGGNRRVVAGCVVVLEGMFW